MIARADDKNHAPGGGPGRTIHWQSLACEACNKLQTLIVALIICAGSRPSGTFLRSSAFGGGVRRGTRLGALPRILTSIPCMGRSCSELSQDPGTGQIVWLKCPIRV
jgi:hypothetical protein